MLDLAILIEDLIDAGLSFDQVENLIERQYKQLMIILNTILVRYEAV